MNDPGQQKANPRKNSTSRLAKREGREGTNRAMLGSLSIKQYLVTGMISEKDPKRIRDLNKS